MDYGDESNPLHRLVIDPTGTFIGPLTRLHFNPAWRLPTFLDKKACWESDLAARDSTIQEVEMCYVISLALVY